MYTTTVEKLTEEMYVSGYFPGASSLEVAILDSNIVALLNCRMCKGSLTFLPFHKEGSYRPFTICDECGYTREF